ncbi:MAG: hypothetical protein MUE85_08070 [Microscillaceae bacterium]|jgi:hypothetical protein|nr:hypothetical protein [Microscillaceae bacterium]
MNIYADCLKLQKFVKKAAFGNAQVNSAKLETLQIAKISKRMIPPYPTPYDKSKNSLQIAKNAYLVK